MIGRRIARLARGVALGIMVGPVGLVVGSGAGLEGVPGVLVVGVGALIGVVA